MMETGNFHLGNCLALVATCLFDYSIELFLSK